MYHNVSRGASPPSASRASKIDLENLEELQDAWCKRYEMLRDPPPPPQLNSPRSLRACAIGGVNPQYTLQKLSLKQHLFRVLGNANMLSALPQQSTVEYRVLMQSALRSFQEATIGLGTSQEKLSAYIAFRNQEELRGTHLDSLRELRRQLVAEEVFEERKRHHHHQLRASGEAGVSMRSTASASRRGSSAHSQGSAQGRRSNVLWSSAMEEGARSRHASVSSQQDASIHVSGHCISPISAALSGSRSNRAPRSNPHRGTAPDVSYTSSIGSAGRVGEVSGVADFTPALSPSGKMPYKPRDVSSLNSSYFGNRSIQSTASNPSNAVLPMSSASARSASTSAQRPVLARKHARQPLVPPSPQAQLTHTVSSSAVPAQHVHEALSDSIDDVDREMSLRAGGLDDSRLASVPKQDLSVISLTSNQLDVLLNPVEAKQSSKPMSTERMHNEIATEHAVTLFHEQKEAVARENEASKEKKSSAAAPPPQPSPLVVKADAESALSVSTASPPSSQPLTPRRRATFTNPLNSPRQLVPNVFPRTGATPLPSASVRVSNSTLPPPPPPLPEVNENKATTAPLTEESRYGSKGQPEGSKTQRQSAEASRASSNASGTSFVLNTLPTLPPPPPITQAEREDGFVYYCANPTRDVTKFYGGGRFPIAGAVRL